MVRKTWLSEGKWLILRLNGLGKGWWNDGMVKWVLDVTVENWAVDYLEWTMVTDGRRGLD